MGEEVPKQTLPLEQKLKEFFQEVPSTYASFREGFALNKIRFRYFSNASSTGEDLSVDWYPFQTVQDLRTKVSLAFRQKGKTVYASQISLLVPLAPFEEESNEAIFEEQQLNDYLSFTCIWRLAQKDEKVQSKPITLQNPFRIAVGDWDPNFVSGTGALRPVRNDDQSRVLIEDTLHSRFVDTPVSVIHVFLSSDVMNTIPSRIARPLSASNWTGRILPYFEKLSIDNQGDLSKEQKDDAEAYIRYVQYSDRLLQEYEIVLRNYNTAHPEKETDKYRLHFVGVKYLVLRWKEPEAAKDVEMLFYELPVTKLMPFLRLIPPDSEAISKILVKPYSIRKIPDIDPPRLFIDWASEDSATPEADYLYGKIMYHEAALDEPINMYGEMRFTTDKTAAFVLAPPKQKRYLESQKHLHDFPRLLQEALKDTPYGSMVPDVHKMSVMCGMRLQTRDRPLTLETLRARVQAMSYVFQEIKPLPGSNALITLRYKPVSNFQTDDRIHQFIKQIEERFELKESEKDMEEITNYVMREFGFSRREAFTRVFKFYSEKIDLVPIDTDAKDFIARYNYGIDIIIKASHPLYTFDIYGLESESTFRRLLTCLTILFGARDRDWVPSQRLYLNFDKAAEEVGKVSVAGKPAEVKKKMAAVLLGDNNDNDDDESKSEEADGTKGTDFFFGEDGDEEAGVLPRDEVTAQEVLKEVLPAVQESKEEAESEGEALEIAKGPAGKKALKAQAAKKKDAKEKNPMAVYFLRRLQTADETLFVFKTDDGKDYSGLCQANYMKQPLVMNEGQFEMLTEKQGKERFVRFGINPKTGEPFQETPPATGSFVTVMAYGSSVANIRYYMCPQYFCYKDEIVLFQEDLDSTRDRKGKPKTVGACPFCGGVVIPKAHKNNPQSKIVDGKLVEETIIDRREFKTPDNKIHDEIGFLTKKAKLHPSKKFWLPCCHMIKDKKTYKRGDDIKPTGEAAGAYEHLYTKAKAPAPAPVKVQPFLSYKIVLEKPETRYIQGATKFPLDAYSTEGPQIGLLFPKLDEFFQQNPNNMVARDFTKSKLQPNGKGFLRLGVQNGRQYLNDSFLSAIAPFINENSIQGVKERFLQEITPKIFMNLNYGNLMIEFYKPEIEIPKEIPLDEWASNNLQINFTEGIRGYVERIYKSYINFQAYIIGDTQLKEYRHFAHFLSSPFPITQNRGILFMILDYNADQTLTIRCPPFGYDDEKHRNCDYGILIHHYSGYWEPIFYVENRASTDTTPAFSRSDLVFQAADEASADVQHAWPAILRKRINEFRTNCVSSLTTSIFTLQSGINPRSMIPFTEAVDRLTSRQVKPGSPMFNGVIKDIYNHTVGITVQIIPQQKFIPIPVVDDGKITYFNKPVYLDWDQFPKAPADRTFKFYQEVIAPLYPNYGIKNKVVGAADNKIVALQLKNGIYLPVEEPTDPAVLASLPASTVQDLKQIMEYEVNKAIFREGTQETGKEKLISAEQNDLEEIYQHLRYTFGNWMTSSSLPKDLLGDIEDTIFRRDLPLFEKRQRLFLLFGTTVQSWLYQKDYKREPIETLLRIDCRIQNEDACTGRCKWRSAEERGAGTGFCYLHAPETGLVGGRAVNVLHIFTYRLIDELLRFPEKRKQLLKTGVPGLIKLNDAVLLGKTQYVVPENTLAWQDLWRMDWVPSDKEEPRDYEEMSVAPAEEEKAAVAPGPPPPPPPAAKKRVFKVAVGALPKLEALTIGESKEADQEEKKEEPETPKVEPPVVKRKPRVFKFKVADQLVNPAATIAQEEKTEAAEVAEVAEPTTKVLKPAKFKVATQFKPVEAVPTPAAPLQVKTPPPPTPESKEDVFEEVIAQAAPAANQRRTAPARALAPESKEDVFENVVTTRLGTPPPSRSPSPLANEDAETPRRRNNATPANEDAETPRRRNNTTPTPEQNEFENVEDAPPPPAAPPRVATPPPARVRTPTPTPPKKPVAQAKPPANEDEDEFNFDDVGVF